MSIKLGMNQFSLLFSQKAEASMARIALESTFTGWYKPFMPEVDNLIYQMGNVKLFTLAKGGLGSCNKLVERQSSEEELLVH
eukprot:Em0002g23a